MLCLGERPLRWLREDRTGLTGTVHRTLPLSCGRVFALQLGLNNSSLHRQPLCIRPCHQANVQGRSEGDTVGMAPRRVLPLLLGSGILLTLALGRSRWWTLLRDLLHYLQSKLHGLPQKDPDEPQDKEGGIADLPECQPLRTVAALLQWQPPPALDADGISPTQRQQAFCAAAGAAAQDVIHTTAGPITCKRPRLLVCHDYKHGYKADCWVQGSNDADALRFWRWECVDIFCYFSHELVTLPPPAWVAAAHAHGTLVLGTFITEWGLGRWRCEQLFASPATAQKAAEQLARLASCYGFDGWLINIENGLSKAALPNLQHFLCHLRSLLKSMCGPYALLVWYDAVTTEGWLQWQNHVSQLNQPFMDACDAIYLNYAWQASTPYEVSMRAAGRSTDVMMGVDVWDRGTYGGGQDKCDVALRAALQHGVSAALFAPGWLYEAFPMDGFQERADGWWDKVSAAWPMRPLPRVASISSFATHFCGGSGSAGYWLQGHKVSDRPWHNMALQQRQPTPFWTQLATTSPQQQQPVQQQQPQLQYQQPIKKPMGNQQQGAAAQWRCRNHTGFGFTGGSCILVEGPAASLQQGPVLCQLYITSLHAHTGQDLILGFAYCAEAMHAAAGMPSQSVPAGRRAEWAVAPVLWVEYQLPPKAAATAAATKPQDNNGIWSSVLVLQTEESSSKRTLQQAGLQVISCIEAPIQDTSATSRGSSGHSSWSALQLHVPHQQVPQDCVVTALGFVCWHTDDGPQPTASSVPVRFYMGHLSLTPASDSMHATRHVSALRVCRPLSYPLSRSQLSPPISHVKDTVDVEMGLATWPTQPHMYGSVQSQAAGAVMGGPAALAGAMKEMDLSCDLCWEVPRSVTGQRMHGTFHAWGRVLLDMTGTTSSLYNAAVSTDPAATHQSLSLAAAAAGAGAAAVSFTAAAVSDDSWSGVHHTTGASIAAEARTAVHAALAAEPPACPMDALGMSPTLIQHNSWTWLGCTIANCYAVRVSCMAACAQVAGTPAQQQGHQQPHSMPEASSVLVQLAVQPARATDGLVVGQIEECASVFVRVPVGQT